MSTQLILVGILVVTVGLLIRAEFLKIKLQSYIFKPVSTLLVITIAAVSFSLPDHNPVYSWGALVGLLFSFGGDVTLLFQEQRKPFIIGLALFLLAHIAYLMVFTWLGQVSWWNLFSGVVLLAAGAGFYHLIRAKLGSMKAPVMVYIVIISLMVMQAVSTFGSPAFSQRQAVMISAGAVLFYLSDLILAATRFWRPWKYGRISLGFYYAGQVLIALAASYF
ncbi:MAG: lysoplasmalogenase [Anaerolineales bacterium]|nr:lysoplasmalogenase [Anaerolineales bacterium]